MSALSLDSALAHALGLSLQVKESAQSGSVAISSSGTQYVAGCVGSETHLLDIPSELAVLVRAVHNNDVAIEQVHTRSNELGASVSPLVLKVLADHSTRTGITIRYTLRDASGNILFETNNVQNSLPFYYMPNIILPSVMGRIPNSGKTCLDRTSNSSIEMQLRKWALIGCGNNFPTYDGASGYGAAVLTATGDIYYGGQYSTFEHRLGVHAEMGVLLNALMDGARDITHIGIASSKFIDAPCSPCGCCRQFIAELSHVYGFSPTILLFASGNDRFESHTVNEILPVQWTNRT